MSRRPPTAQYEPWMRRAIKLARTAAPITGDPAVGAVVYDMHGTELGQGSNRRDETGDPTALAVVVALRKAAQETGTWRLEGCTVVTTMEPDTMSAGALTAARVKRLVIGSWDPYCGAVSSLWDVIRDRRLNHYVEVVPEVLSHETDKLTTDYWQREHQHAKEREHELRLGL